MTCRPQSGSSLLLLLVLLLLVQATLQAQPMSGPPEPQPLPLQTESLQQSELPPTDPWESFESLWSSLKSELTESDQDWQRLQSSLQELQTETAALRSSLTASTRLYESSEAARMIEREQASLILSDAIRKGSEAEKARDGWMAIASIAGAVAAIGWIVAALSMVF
jgi:septal ring factor EnvC (AmiA/AmiB activator)